MTVRKRCGKCGWTGRAKLRQRRCYQRTFGRGSYCCWGQLERVVRRRPASPDHVPTPPGLGLGWQVSEEAEGQRMQAFRDAASKQRDRAQARVHRAQRDADDLVRLLTKANGRLRKAQRDVERHGRDASLSDADIAALKERRKAAFAKGRAKTTRRGMKVD